ncbi:MAG: FecR domain-containing protein [Burkholderiales bacterium]|nr:FecR domain-containing protein [Burkholderiales bacterium]
MLKRVALAAALLLLGGNIASAAPAAEVVFAFGEVRASVGDESRTLRKGDSIDESETVTTGAGGRVQLRFKDGAFVALQPASSLRVDRYRHVGKGDAEDSVWLSFLQGGLRTLSGAVGKEDPKAYRMDSPVATIGIRGTGYALDLGDGLLGSVSEGAVEVCNAGGCGIFGTGEAFEVRTLSEPPRRTERRLTLQAPPARATASTTQSESESGAGAAAGPDEARNERSDAKQGVAQIALPPPIVHARDGEAGAGTARAKARPGLQTGAPISGAGTAPLQSNDPAASHAPIEKLPAGPPVKLDTSAGAPGGGSSGGGNAGGGNSGGGGGGGGGGPGGGSGGSPGKSGSAPGHNKTFLPPGQFKKQ